MLILNIAMYVLMIIVPITVGVMFYFGWRKDYNKMKTYSIIGFVFSLILFIIGVFTISK